MAVVIAAVVVAYSVAAVDLLVAHFVIASDEYFVYVAGLCALEALLVEQPLPLDTPNMPIGDLPSTRHCYIITWPKLTTKTLIGDIKRVMILLTVP